MTFTVVQSRHNSIARIRTRRKRLPPWFGLSRLEILIARITVPTSPDPWITNPNSYQTAPFCVAPSVCPEVREETRGAKTEDVYLDVIWATS